MTVSTAAAATAALEPLEPEEPAPAPAGPRDALGPLAKRASLTAAASTLDYGVKIAVSLVVTPFLVTGLGRAVYGMWEMLARLGTYASMTDGRPTEALRLIVAQQQGATDDELKRRYVGAALAVWLITLPIVLLTGAVLAWWLAPALTHATLALRGQVTLSTALLVVGLAITGLAAVPESVLRGMNLGYRRMGLQASLNVVGGALAVAAVIWGMGLPGLAGAQVLRAVFTGICFWLLVGRFVKWFGVRMPSRADIRMMLGMSVWLSAGDVIAKIMLASDVLILGAIVAPAVVTTYVLTGYAARTAIGIHLFAAGAAIPGLGGVLGGGQTARAARARTELLTLTWLFATAMGATILLWNRSFLTLWVGGQHYAGPWVDLLIVLIATQTAFIRTDSYIIDATLKPRMRVVVGAAAAVLTIVLGITLSRMYGLTGLCIGMLAGRAIQTVAYPILVRATLTPGAKPPWAALAALRYVVVTAVLFLAAAWAGPRVDARHWTTWAVGVTVTLALATTAALTLGPRRAARRALISRLRSLAPKRSRP